MVIRSARFTSRDVVCPIGHALRGTVSLSALETMYQLLEDLEHCAFLAAWELRAAQDSYYGIRLLLFPLSRQVVRLLFREVLVGFEWPFAIGVTLNYQS